MARSKPFWGVLSGLAARARLYLARKFPRNVVRPVNVSWSYKWIARQVYSRSVSVSSEDRHGEARRLFASATASGRYTPH
jgi:hypothetical protein